MFIYSINKKEKKKMNRPITTILAAIIAASSLTAVEAVEANAETISLNYSVDEDHESTLCSYYAAGEQYAIKEQATVLNTGEVLVDFIAMDDIIKPEKPEEDIPYVFRTGFDNPVLYDTKQYSLAVENDTFGLFAEWSPFTQQKNSLAPSYANMWEGRYDDAEFDSRLECFLPFSIKAEKMPDVINAGDTLFTLRFTPCMNDFTMHDVYIVAERIKITPSAVKLNPNEIITTENPYAIAFAKCDSERGYMIYPNGDIIITMSNHRYEEDDDESIFVDKKLHLSVPEGYTANVSFADDVKNTSAKALDKGVYEINYTFDVIQDRGYLCSFTLHRNAPVKEDIYLAGDMDDTLIIEHGLINRFAPTGIWGDANTDEKVNMADVVLIMQSIANPDKYGLNHEEGITEQGLLNADVYENGGGVTNMDALTIQKYLLELIESLPEE